MSINEIEDSVTKEIKYKGPGSDVISAIDQSVDTYETFVGPESGWKDAEPYDQKTLGKYYNGSYNLQTVIQLAGSNAPADYSDYFVNTHYGDWPAPEIFVING